MPILVRALRVLPTLLACVLALSALPAAAQDDLARVNYLESRVEELERARHSHESEAVGASLGAVLFLFGAFCALWAQNTRRNAWVWFFAGCLFHVLAVVVLLAKNAGDRDPPRGEFDLNAYRVP